MRELSQWVFEATQGEEISLQVLSIDFQGNFVGVGLDEPTLRGLQGPDYVLSFKASKPPGQSHLLIFEFNFPSYAPTSACYEVKLSCSHGLSFTRFISKSDASHDRDLVFTISAETDSLDASKPYGAGGAELIGAQPPTEEPYSIILDTPTAVSLLSALRLVSRGRSEAQGIATSDPNVTVLVVGEATAEDLLHHLSVGTAHTENDGLIAIALKRASAEDLANSLMIGLGGAGPPEDRAGLVEIRIVRDVALGLFNALMTNLGGVGGGKSQGARPDAPIDDQEIDDQERTEQRETIGREINYEDKLPRSGRWDQPDEPQILPPQPPRRGSYKRAKPPDRLGPVEEKAANGGSQSGSSDHKPVSHFPHRSKPRIVNVGFAARESPAKRIAPDMQLGSDRQYFFWLEVGRLLKGNIDVSPVSLPTRQLPPNAALKVVLFSFKGELQISRSADVGELKLSPDGSVVVERPVIVPSGLNASSRVLKRRLFFPVRTPKQVGVFRLRCNIYHKQVLIQSRIIRARVVSRPRRAEGALRSTVDYRLARTLSADHLAGIEPHRLSIMLNDNGDGTHGLRFWGEGAATEPGFKQDATISGQKLQDLVRQARGGLRRVSWGDEDQWQTSKPYLYSGPRTFVELKTDLVALAKRGYRFYDGIIDHFTKGTTQTAGQLADLMLKPGNVQIALKESATLLIPASMLYDYPLDDGLKSHKVCFAFEKDFKAAASLEQTDCFNGLCPSRNKLDTVCPSGFWGYRHLIGLPLSLAGAENAPAQIDWQTAPELTVAMSTNLGFYDQHRKAIEKELKAKWPGLGWNYAETRASTLEYLKEKAPQLVYFYCHGGLESNAPYIRVGPPTDDKLTRGNLRAYKIRWEKRRPLVFINGCHTTAVEPEQALEFVSAFVEIANASGVIGTEITVFEPLAKRFAEELVRRFVLNGKSIGEAVRGARLALLKEGNPLGLVYIPFVMASLKRRESADDN